MTTKPTRITGYRVDRWLNKTTNEAMFGVNIQIEIRWARVCSKGHAVIRDTKSEADTYIVEMKAERNSRGYKIK